MRSLLDVDPAVVRVPADAAEDARELAAGDLPDGLAAVIVRGT